MECEVCVKFEVCGMCITYDMSVANMMCDAC